MASERVHVFLGTDEARVKEAALEAVRRLSPPQDSDFSNDIIDGQAETSEEAEARIYDALQALQTLPFFGSKVVWLRGANCFADNQLGNAQATVAAADRLVQSLEAGLPENVAFVLSAATIDKRRSFYKRLQKVARFEVFDRPDIGREGWERKLAPLVRQRARMIGLDLAAADAEFFVALVGEDTRRLDSELEKLRAYAGTHAQVDEDDIRLVVSKSRGGLVFEIGNAIGRRDLRRALASLDHFLELGESPVSIIRAGIIPKVRTLLGAHELARANPGLRAGSFDDFKAAVARLPEEATAHLARNKSGEISLYPIFLALGEARQFGAEELVGALESCLEADRQLVNTGIEASVVLGQLLVRILSRPASASASA